MVKQQATPFEVELDAAKRLLTKIQAAAVLMRTMLLIALGVRVDRYGKREPPRIVQPSWEWVVENLALSAPTFLSTSLSFDSEVYWWRG